MSNGIWPDNDCPVMAVPCLLGTIVLEATTMIVIVGSFWPIVVWAMLVWLYVVNPFAFFA